MLMIRDNCFSHVFVDFEVQLELEKYLLLDSDTIICWMDSSKNT